MFWSLCFVTFTMFMTFLSTCLLVTMSICYLLICRFYCLLKLFWTTYFLNFCFDVLLLNKDISSFRLFWVIIFSWITNGNLSPPVLYFPYTPGRLQDPYQTHDQSTYLSKTLLSWYEDYIWKDISIVILYVFIIMIINLVPFILIFNSCFFGKVDF